MGGLQPPLKKYLNIFASPDIKYLCINSHWRLMMLTHDPNKQDNDNVGLLVENSAQH